MRDIVDPVFSIGISSLWDELRHMPAGGVWWFNVDRHEDAISLANQTIASQAETAHVAVISMDSDPAKIFQLDDSQGPEKIKLFSMLNHEKGLYYLTRDLQCSIDPHNYLFILVCANNAWQNIPAERLRSWLDKMNKWSRLNHCSLLVINPGNNNDKQFSLLLEEYRSLFGLASLRFQGDQHLLDIAFWCNEKGVSARQQLSVQQQNGIWTLVQSEEAEIQPRSDEKRILSNVAVLEGAPVYDDTAVLNRWLDVTEKDKNSRSATFYNTLPLHDGNHYPGVSKTADYKARAQKFFDELDAFFTELEKSGRKVMVVVVPEHGGALKGDRMQVSGLRDIPSPSITDVPVGVKFFGMKAPHQGAPIVIDQPSSFLAISDLVVRVLDGKIFTEDNVDWKKLTSGLPQTAPVSENSNAVVIQYQDKPYVRLNGGDWVPYPQ
ncbi:cellulose biosynthesis protein BcsG [Escherichia coli]|nr:cellulose biosynthesis protein BcsG [Escherichia coli]EKA8766478.1 cellulose biosynthesis protein BcsG [Escherichia coli]ELX9764162.1 cellulose biosynthesis protein BcsG [Escherichia coli]